MLKMVDGTGIIGVDMVCPLGGAVSPPQPPNYDKVEVEGVGNLMLPNSLKAPLERLELIGNSMQGENPSPDNPQEIKSAGRKSKNLFNIADLRVGQVQKDGTINEKQIYYRTVILDVPQDGKYRITFNSNDDYTMLYFTEAYANGAYWNPYIRVHAGSPNYYITLAKGKNILSFSTHTASGNIAFTTDHNIMIAAESETLDYEPYGNFLDMKITGKNLFDINNYVGSINKISESEFHTEPKWGTLIGDINLKAGGEYNISYTFEIDSITNSDCGVRIKCTKSNGTVSYIFDLPKMTGYVCNYAKSAVVPVGTVKCEILLYTDVKLKIGGTFKKLMIAEDSENVALNIYEPYTEQFAKIALNEPLRGIGEYNDTITKDGVARKIKKAVFDGSEGWSIDKIVEGNTTQTFVLILKDVLSIPNHDKRIMCDKFKFGTALWTKDIVAIGTYSNKLYLNVEKDKTPDLQTFKTWLSQNPLTVDYVLAEPVTEPLPESVQQQLQALHSENGVTHVFVDSGEVPCGIKLTYRKEK